MGRGIDFDHVYGYQCVDLIRQYLVEVLGLPGYTIPALGTGGARSVWFNPAPGFLKVPNTPLNVPLKGDIVVWGYYPFVTGFSGHIAVFHEGNVNVFTSFDQNYPKGSLCHLQSHSYKGVIGWLRKNP